MTQTVLTGWLFLLAVCLAVLVCVHFTWRCRRCHSFNCGNILDLLFDEHKCDNEDPTRQI